MNDSMLGLLSTNVGRMTLLFVLQWVSVSAAMGQRDAVAVTLKWHTSLNKAKAESERTGKPILMEIHGRPWCPPCVAQGEDVMRHRDFIDWVGDRFVLLEIQVGQGYSKSEGSPIWAEQFKKYRLPGIPATVILADGMQAIGIVYPQPDVSHWLGAASNILTTHTLRKRGQASEPLHVIPFRMTPANNLSVPSVLDGRLALNLMFHTAVDAVSLTRATTKLCPELLLDKRVGSETWGGASVVRFGESRLAIGPLAAQRVTVFEDAKSGDGTDGKFGPEQLGSGVFQIDFERSQIQLWSKVPQDIAKEQAGWKRLPMRRESGMMFVSGDLSSGQQGAPTEFMLHSGYSGFGLLSSGFVSDTPFLNELPVESQSSLMDSAGNRLTTKLVHVPQFRMGDESVKSAPFSFFDGAIRSRQFNVLGCDFLRRFNWCFDVEAGDVYLKKNADFDALFFSPK
ncbi:MAG: thioredoxin family protein [Planctomycetota bacterium]